MEKNSLFSFLNSLIPEKEFPVISARFLGLLSKKLQVLGVFGRPFGRDRYIYPVIEQVSALNSD